MFRRFIFANIAVAALSITLGANGASADPYKWCAVYGDRAGYSATNCGFVTLEQCRAAISGIGGDCEPNQFYTGPDEKPAKRTRKRHHD
jgi:hypothetical protein